MDAYVSVPLQDAESALPIARISLTHIAFATVSPAEHPVVRLDDSSAYEIVPLRVTDSPKISIFGI